MGTKSDVLKTISTFLDSILKYRVMNQILGVPEQE
jgi:hypothetical protein